MTVLLMEDFYQEIEDLEQEESTLKTNITTQWERKNPFSKKIHPNLICNNKNLKLS